MTPRYRRSRGFIAVAGIILLSAIIIARWWSESADSDRATSHGEASSKRTAGGDRSATRERPRAHDAAEDSEAAKVREPGSEGGSIAEEGPSFDAESSALDVIVHMVDGSQADRAILEVRAPGRMRTIPFDLVGNRGQVDHLPTGDVALSLKIAGHPRTEAQAWTLDADVLGTIDFVVESAPQPIEIFVEGAQRQALEDAHLTLWQRRGQRLTYLGEGRTDRNGRYLYEGVESASVCIRVTSAGHAPLFARDVFASDQDAIVLTMTGESTLDVWVVDENGDVPSGVVVSLRSIGDADLLDGERVEPGSLIADDGSPLPAQFLGLAAGSYRVSAQCDLGFVTQRSIDIAAANRHGLTLRVAAGFQVRGSITVDGQRVEGGTLHARGPSHHSDCIVDERGDFAIDLRMRGTHWFTYRSDDGELHRSQLRIDDDRAVRLDFVTHAVRGRVLTSDGAPAAGVSGMLSGAIHVFFTTDDHGRFELDHLLAGDYRWLFQDKLPVGCAVVDRQVTIDRDVDIEYRFAAADLVELDPRRADGRVYEGRLSVWVIDAERLLPLRPNDDGLYPWPRGAPFGLVTGADIAEQVFRPRFDRPTTIHLQSAALLTVNLADGERPLPDHEFRVQPIDESIASPPILRRTGPSATKTLRLAPGRYRVTADLATGRRSSRDIDLTEEHSNVVTLF